MPISKPISANINGLFSSEIFDPVQYYSISIYWLISDLMLNKYHLQLFFSHKYWHCINFLVFLCCLIHLKVWNFFSQHPDASGGTPLSLRASPICINPTLHNESFIICFPHRPKLGPHRIPINERAVQLASVREVCRRNILEGWFLICLFLPTT